MGNAGYLTNAAMLLFCNDPEKWQLGAYTKIGYFESDADLLYQDEIHGSLLDQIDRIVKLVQLKYMFHPSAPTLISIMRDYQSH